MNEQYLIHQYIGERTDQDMNNPAVNSDPFADKVPLDAALIQRDADGWSRCCSALRWMRRLSTRLLWTRRYLHKDLAAESIVEGSW